MNKSVCTQSNHFERDFLFMISFNINILNSTSFTDFFSDGLDSLIIDPAHPCYTVFKCSDDALHHNFHLEKKNGVISFT